MQPQFVIETVSQLIFFLSIAAIIFAYIGYPLFIFVLSRLFYQPIRRAKILPNVSMIIAARNEEANIAAKLENALSLNYPKENFEIIVASDASTDQTDEIVIGFADQGVILHRQEERMGKTRAQYSAVKHSSGEVLVFSDATTMYEPDVIEKLVRNFADPRVGCVAGQLIYVDSKTSAVGQGCRSYWNYEKLLKSWESQTGSLIGVSGCLYAVRRSCQMKLAVDMIDDFVIATEIHLQGLRTVYEPEAISKEDTNHRSEDEMKMRVRVIEQTMRALHRYREVLNPFRHGLFALQLIGHKIMRYLIPVFLILAFLANIGAYGSHQFFKLTMLGQVVFYTAAALAWTGTRLGLNITLLSLPYYFLLVSFASVQAFLKFIRGKSHVTWEPQRDPRRPKQEQVLTSQPESLSEARS